MESYYLFSNGELKRKDNVIRLTAPDGRFKDLKVEMTREIFLFGEVDLNTKCLNYIGQLGIPVHIFNYYGFYSGSYYPREANVSGELLVAQVRHYADEAKRHEIAVQFVESASFNILRNLRYYRQRDKDVDAAMAEIKLLRKRIAKTANVQELMGIEGNIRKVYYRAWQAIINQEIDFEKRVKRPPDNMINTLISYVNSLVYSSCLTEIYKTQLNPAISYLHSAGERRFSLCLDISEVFKPLIADRLIFSMLNKNIITEKDFEREANFCYMKKEARQKILQAYDLRMKETVKHRELARNVSYRHLIRLECYKLIKHLMNDKPYEGFKIWW
ncbi:type I-B CRISPR-associated endonuclease Cas1b [Listeria booriae]|uniref:CRISPR-associated endonuclease Cas1 n=1 Tax=Listeria booriae TaxID=1552123 RepID=A0A841ZZC0_9LIST|nr:type I-B CRISPR-associated endonuclease Cas1b [Listeria booriae]MBC1566026.1 type I-B CRISPR-associated endonuclease Cas1 [Listeria booriae]